MQLKKGQHPRDLNTRSLRLILAGNLFHIKNLEDQIKNLRKSLKAKKDINSKIHKVLRRRESLK